MYTVKNKLYGPCGEFITETLRLETSPLFKLDNSMTKKYLKYSLNKIYHNHTVM